MQQYKPTCLKCQISINPIHCHTGYLYIKHYFIYKNIKSHKVIKLIIHMKSFIQLSISKHRITLSMMTSLKPYLCRL